MNNSGTLWDPELEPNNEQADQYLFNRKEVKVALILAYSFVFACCFLGNLLVIAVVFLHRRMRTVTNFFLTNLAFADLCVGVFCVYQNLSFYLTSRWDLGDGLCKMYHFINSLSYTASIAILMVICVERYMVIMHPLWSKRVLTLGRLGDFFVIGLLFEILLGIHGLPNCDYLFVNYLRNALKIVLVLLWIASAAYCSPRLIMYGTISVPSETNGVQEDLCVLKRSLYDSKIYDLCNFLVCFVIPLLFICVMYSIICVRLWSKSPVQIEETNNARQKDLCESCSSFEPEHLPSEERRSESKFCRNDSLHSTVGDPGSLSQPRNKKKSAPISSALIQSRRKVIRLLVALVLSFALCNLPFHARKLFQYWSPSYDGTSSTAAIVTIVTTLVLYMNSGLNPLMYAFLSDNFRKAMADVVLCRLFRKRTWATKSVQDRSITVK